MSKILHNQVKAKLGKDKSKSDNYGTTSLEYPRIQVFIEVQEHILNPLYTRAAGNKGRGCSLNKMLNN